MKNRTLTIARAQSGIEWIGRKVTGSHNGTIAVKEGELILKDEKLAGGRFVVDTTSIKILDIADPVTNAQFAGHLASDDFFSSQKFPEAVLEITSVRGGDHVEGNLTIKGITHPIAFDAVVNTSEGQVTATARLIIDRTKYDMKFRSGNFFKDLGDTLIYNEFELSVRITAKTAKTSLTVLA